MKKENRKMAQQRRAEERKKLLFRKKLKKILCVAVPAAAVLILIIVLVNSSHSSSDDTASSGSNNTTAEASSDTDTADKTSDDGSNSGDNGGTSYSTDTSLTVADGDTVNIDYVGTIDGVEFSGGNTNGSGADLLIGSGSYIDDFEEQLIGSHPGDVVEVNVTFPENYGNESLNGKDAVFEVTVNGIYQ